MYGATEKCLLTTDTVYPCIYSLCIMLDIIWATTGENLSSGVCEAQSCRPACTSVQFDQRLCFRLLESIISRHAMSEISSFYLVSVAEEAGLNLTLMETLKTGFLASWPI